MDYNPSGGGGDVQPSLHHMPSHAHAHAHPHAHHQYQTPQSATGPSFATQYHGHAQGPHVMAHDASNLHPSHVHQQAYYADPNATAARQSLATPSTPSQDASPRFAHMPSPAQQARQQTYASPPHSFVPQDRALPSRDVNDPTFEDSYAQFVLYCNPSFPLDIDTTELKQVFRSPPKSDGKSFNTFTLFELLKRLENKELKTWTELALELGVERPSLEKGQSSQKVQQYSVRLKRWMRALHIDAFFEYLMGKTHSYYRQIPPLTDPYPEARDGVPVEEDLAIRALDPKFKPKRGRRRADEQDEDMDPMSAVEPKRPHLDTSVAFHNRGDEYSLSAYPSSAVPMSAHPDFANNDPWSGLTTPASALAPRSAVSSASQQLRWRNETPTTPHPLSAMTPMTAHPDHWDAEPQSAVTPSSARSAGRRRRHGPAVSSAWPSTNTTANGKLRGRPPSNRSVRDGPFVTFPANPRTKEGPTIDLASNRQQQTQTQPQSQRETSSDATPTPGATESPKPSHQFLTPQLPTPISASTSHPILPRLLGQSMNPTTQQQRPERLQLQVPQHVGGPVHLVTPTLLVNGQLNEQAPSQQQQPISATLQTPAVSTASTTRTTASSFFGPPADGTQATDFEDDAGAQHGHSFLTPKTSPRVTRHRGHVGTEDLKRALVASLLRADIEGRGRRLRGTEAKDLADAILRKLNAQSDLHESASGGSAEELQKFLTASWLGLSSSSTNGIPQTPSTSGGTKKIIVRRYRISDGYEYPLEENEPVNEGDDIKEAFDVEWEAQFGALSGKFSIKDILIHNEGDGSPGNEGQMEVDEADAGGGGEEWRTKFLKSEELRKKQQEELEDLRGRILEAVL